jgi:hypothetical protein
LKALRAAKTTSPLVRHCQRAFNIISNPHSVGLFWVPRPPGIHGNESAKEPARQGSVHQFVGPQLALGVSRQNIKKTQCWLVNQHDTVAGSYQHSETGSRIDQSPAAKTRLLFSNRPQSRVVTGRNTLRRRLYILGLIDSPLCKRFREVEASAHVLCEMKLCRQSDTPWIPCCWILRMSEI